MSWKERLVAEHVELAGKAIGLVSYLAGDDFFDRTPEEVAILRRQRDAMIAYHDALSDRLKAS